MRIRTFGSVIALSSVATAVVGVTACGDDTTVRTTEPCTSGSNECVSEKVGRACPEGPEPGWVYFACGDTEVCDMGACVLDPDQAGRLGLCEEDQKECVSEALARQCAKGGDAWLPLACAAGTACYMGDCIPAGNIPDAGPAPMICNPGAVECATEYAVRTCQNDGSEWIVSLCEAGELCEDGACVQNRESACIPNTSQCLDSQNGLRCREDGQGYDEFTCPDEAPCEGFKCMGTVCTPGETKCPDPIDELGSQPLAVQDHIFAGGQMFQCNAAGDGWDVIPCGIDEMCVYNSLTPSESAAYEDLFITYLQDSIAVKQANNNSYPYSQQPLPTAPLFVHPPNRFMEASCVMPNCEFALGKLEGDITCGDPSDEAVDPQGFYSRCEGLAPFSNPQWVPYTCQAPEMCDPNSYYYDDPCTTDCIPGEVVCGEYFGLDSDSVYGCNEDGEWEEEVSCNPGVEKALTCFQHYPEDGSGELRSASCVDPVCAQIWNYYDDSQTTYGVCNGAEIQVCDENGRVVPAAEAVPCDAGRCSDNGQYFDGYILGWCEEECTDGETRCVDIDGTSIEYYGWGQAYDGSPFFMTCVDGVWETAQYEACPMQEDGIIPQACFQIWEYAQQGEVVSNVVCGGECQPGFRQCDPLNYDGIETCEAGFWSEPEACDVGSCRDERPDYNEADDYALWDAECAFDCVPGTYVSQMTQGLPEGADGSASLINYYNEVLCGEDGRYEEPVICDGPATQFLVDEHVGCHECYGPELAYYWTNYRGYEFKVESKCEDGEIVWCGADNTWQEPESCGAGNTCYTWSDDTFRYTSGESAFCSTEPPPPPVVDGGSDGGQQPL